MAVGLRGDAEGAAEIVEVVDVGRTQIDFERLIDLGHRHAQRFRFVAIHFEAKARRAGFEERERAADARRLVGGHHHRHRSFGERGIAMAFAVLDHHLDAGAVADAIDRRRTEDEHLRFLDGGQRLAHVVQDFVGAAAGADAFVERREAEEDGGGIGGLREGRGVEADEARIAGDAFDGADAARGFLHDGACALHRRAFRQLHQREAIAAVHLGDEALRREEEQRRP